jgi:quercetin dioxygenase-like cupin family protein
LNLISTVSQLGGEVSHVTQLLVAAGTALVVLRVARVASAQVGVKTTSLLQTTKTEVGQDIRYPSAHPEITMLLLEIAPGGQTGRHMHPVPSANYVLEGEVTIELEGLKRLTYPAGQAFVGAVQAWHNAFNRGTIAAKVLVVFVGQKGEAATVFP